MSDADETPAMKNPEKDPQDWTTGDEPMTGPQRSYLQTLCREAKEDFDDSLTKAEASKRIEELQAKPDAEKTPSSRAVSSGELIAAGPKDAYPPSGISSST